MAFVGWKAADDDRPYSAWAVGDEGPWARWIPDVWRAAADPAGRHPTPAVPRGLREKIFVDESAVPTPQQRHAEVIAWWNPLVHLLEFGLGWVDIGVGLTRWLDLGRPVEEAVLSVVDRWWGGSVIDCAAWYAPDERGHPLLADELRARRRALEWTRVWGGGSDALHIGSHLTPHAYDSAQDTAFFIPATSTTGGDGAHGSPRRVLVADTYAGWYRKLDSYTSAGAGVQSERVDVFCRSIGWMGQYRRSRLTGRWFRGRHRWHELGAI